jgi:hypothetical protein
MFHIYLNFLAQLFHNLRDKCNSSLKKILLNTQTSKMRPLQTPTRRDKIFNNRYALKSQVDKGRGYFEKGVTPYLSVRYLILKAIVFKIRVC